MRIGIDFQASQRKNTGLGIYVENLLLALRKVAPESEYLTYSRETAKEPNTLGRLWWENIELPRRVRRNLPDILHVPGFAAPLRKPCSLVLTVPDVIGMIYSDHLGVASRFYWSRWVPSSVKRADAIIAISEATRNDVTKFLGVDPKTITVTPLAARPCFNEDKGQDFEREEELVCELNLRKPFIVTVGTLEPRKNHVRLITAFSRFQQKFTEYSLVLVGDKAWGFPQIQQTINSLNLSRKVLCLGYVGLDVLQCLYHQCDFFVFPSLYEGFGLPVVEAMACGAACLISNVSSIPEVGGDAALYCDPLSIESIEEGMRILADNNEKKLLLRQRAKGQAARFSWEKTAEQTLRVYEECVKRRETVYG